MKQAHNRTRGAVLVELAIVLPLTAALLLSIVDLGVTIHEHQVLQSAAREGARFSSLPRNWVNPIVNPVATEDAIKQRVVDYLAQERITVAKSDVTVDQNYPIPVGTLTVRGSQITVTYDRSLLIAGGPLLPFSKVTLKGTSVFRNLY